MAAIFEDPSVFEAFAGQEMLDHSKAEKVKVEILDWSKGGDTLFLKSKFPLPDLLDNDQPRSYHVPAPELATIPEPHLRIV